MSIWCFHFHGEISSATVLNAIVSQLTGKAVKYKNVEPWKGLNNITGLFLVQQIE